MREYGKVSPQFWIGKSGKALRGNAEAQILALYLMTSPHANMIGVYHCPIAYMAHETGLSTEGASKALQCLIDSDFCTFDADDEYVFVHQFAAHQVGESLSSSDKRCKGVENELSKVPKNQCWQSFRARYAVPYNLPILASDECEREAPSEGLGSQKQKQKQKQNIKPSVNGLDERFSAFWKAYPKKTAKDDARKAFDKRKPDEEMLSQMLAALAVQTSSAAWTKDGGQYIPMPATWLNGGRWQDEVAGSAQPSVFAGCI
jgi:hypothetical protein